MQRNLVTDASQIVFLPALEELNLSNNQLSVNSFDAVSEALQALPELSMLELQAHSLFPF